MRGPYGNGFDVDMFKGKEIVLVTGGSGLSPVHGVIDYFADHMNECKSLTVISGRWHELHLHSRQSPGRRGL